MGKVIGVGNCIHYIDLLVRSLRPQSRLASNLHLLATLPTGLVPVNTRLSFFCLTSLVLVKVGLINNFLSAPLFTIAKATRYYWFMITRAYIGYYL